MAAVGADGLSLSEDEEVYVYSSEFGDALGCSMTRGEDGDSGGDTNPLEDEEEVDEADREPDGEARGEEFVRLRSPFLGLSSTGRRGRLRSSVCCSISSSESA